MLLLFALIVWWCYFWSFCVTTEPVLPTDLRVQCVRMRHRGAEVTREDIVFRFTEGAAAESLHVPINTQRLCEII